MNKRISVSTAVRRAFELVLDHAHIVVPAVIIFLSLLFLVGIAAIFPVLKVGSTLAMLQNLTGASTEAIQQVIVGFFRDNPQVIRNMFFAVALIWAVTLWLSIGLIHIILDLYDHGTSTVARLFSGSFKTWAKMFVAAVLFMLMLIPAFVAFIIPGFYIMIRFMFYPYFMVDKDAGIIESFTLSWHATKGHFWALVATIVVCAIIGGSVSLSPLALLLISGLVMAILAHVYRQLSQQEIAVVPSKNVSESL